MQLESAATISGQVLLPSGGPAPAGTAVLARATGAGPGAKGAYAYGYVQSAGRFTLNGLGPHTFTIVAGGAQSGMIAVDSVSGVRAGATDVVCKVKPGVRVTGRLLDADGDPVGTHLLTAHHTGGAPGPSARTTVESEDGRFTFAGVAPGPCRVTAYLGDRYVTVGTFTAPAQDVVLRVPRDE